MADDEYDTEVSGYAGEEIPRGALHSIAAAVREGKLEPQDITIEDHQEAHFTKIAEQIVPNHIGWLDGSSTGLGKSYVTSAVSITHNIPLFVLCPKNVKMIWRDMVAAYGLKCVEIITFERLSGKGSSKDKETKTRTERVLSHGYLTRIDNPYKMTEGKKKKGEKIETVSYKATDKFIKLVEDGVLIVFDECQKIKKSTTMMFKACQELTKTLMKVQGTSRFAMLSATPFDEKKYTLSFYKLMGFLTENSLYRKNPISRQINYLGIQEIINLATTFDSVITNEIFEEYTSDLSYCRINREKAEDFMFDIFVKVIKNTIGSTMKNPENKDYTAYIVDGFFNIPKEDRKSIRQNVEALRGLATPIIDGVEKWTVNRISQIGTALKAIEIDKVYLFALLAGQKLNENTTNKVVLCMNYRRPVKMLAEILADFEPLILQGKKLKKGEKTNDELVADFQTSRDKRLIIMTIKTGGVGINLNDTLGGNERYMYISPNYSIGDIYQAIGRVNRPVSTKSDVHVYIVYGVNKGTTELEIISALARKKNILKASIPNTHDNSDNKIKYPGEYPRFEEPDDEEEVEIVKVKRKGALTVDKIRKPFFHSTFKA